MLFFVYQGLKVYTNPHLFLKERSAPVGEPHSLTEDLIHIRMLFQYPYYISSCKGARSARTAKPTRAYLSFLLMKYRSTPVGESHLLSGYSSY